MPVSRPAATSVLGAVVFVLVGAWGVVNLSDGDWLSVRLVEQLTASGPSGRIAVPHRNARLWYATERRPMSARCLWNAAARTTRALR
jgi:hypothetical protein